VNHALHLWADDRRMAVIGHDARDDRWRLTYDAAWRADPRSFPLSPALPLLEPEGGHASASIKRFIEHLLPEGRALDVAVQYNGLARTNIFGLIRALGVETAGALRFTAEAADRSVEADPVPREVSLRELDERMDRRETLPFTVWDGKVRMSMAGLQDKLLVFLDRPLTEGGRMFLVDGRRLASTHLLKPDPGEARTPHLAVNEHFCMSLARRMGLPAAEVCLVHTPRPVLVVRRFDRVVVGSADGRRVQRLHIVDACQVCDLPVSCKYERNLGNGPEVRHVREGVSFERLFQCADLTANKAVARLTLLRWALFQFLIGNSDAHGKNFSFFVRPGGLLAPADWYDLVSVLQYDGFDTELAMAFGDVFVHEEVSAHAMADFAQRCGIERRLMRREGQRLAKLVTEAAREQARSPEYLTDERSFVARLAHFVEQQAQRLATLVAQAASVRTEFL
jgi:serine/threonine-protein kinase HipA